MITEAVVSTLLGVLRGLLQPLPEQTVDVSQWSAGASSIGAYASALNGYAPIASVGVGLGVALGTKAALLVWQGAVWVYHQFWGSN